VYTAAQYGGEPGSKTVIIPVTLRFLSHAAFERGADRLVIYQWPRAGGVDFSFRFRPRFAMSAKAADSSLYDYYNPEAQAVVTPAKFVVSEPRH
jgi:hypothetical protein